MRRRLVSWELAALVAPGVVVAGAQPVGTPVAALLDKYGREPERSAATAADATAAYAFAVVGGYHFSGTSLVDRLISTQPWALGAVRPPETRSYGVVLPNCARPGCRAPEAEVNFWTSEVYAGAGCGTGQNWGWTGTCAQRWLPARESSLAPRLTSRFPPRWSRDARERAPKVNASAARRRFWGDVAPFYVGCTRETKYVVTKSILNTYNVPLMGAVLGMDRTAFVFAARHPFGGCPARPEMRCDRAKERLHWWLEAYEVLAKDLETHAARYAVLQLERLVDDPSSVLEALARVLSLDGTAITWASVRNSK